MKFELVGFYPVTEKSFCKKDRHLLGTVHVYLVDSSMDLRGIRVTSTGKNVFYHLPHAWGTDGETGERVKYPLIRFTNDDVQNELISFLKNSLDSVAFDTIKVLKPLRDACKGPSELPKMKRQPDIAGNKNNRLKPDSVRNWKSA